MRRLALSCALALVTTILLFTGCAKDEPSTAVSSDPAGGASAASRSGLIAFSRGGAGEQYVLDLATDESKPAGDLKGGATWLPDGRGLIGQAQIRATDAFRIWSAADGTVETLHFEGVPDDLWGAPLLAPDGPQAVVGDYHSLWLLDLQTRTGKRLTNIDVPESDLKNLPRDDWPGAWSPDGTRIAFLRSGSRALDREDDTLYILDIATGEEREHSRWLRGGVSIEGWSPDGKHVIVQLAGSDEMPEPRAHLFDVATEEFVEYSPGPAGGDRIRFSPSGDRLVYRSNQSGKYRFYIAKDLSEVGEMVDGCGGDDHSAAWSPDGNSLVIIGMVDRQIDLWLQPAKPGKPSERLTNDTEAERSPEWAP